jgi:ActR/RegA family two-component response regulator
MKHITGGLGNVVAHLEAKGILTPSDTTAIVNALENLQADSSAAAPQAQKALSGPYWEARHQALHNRKFHP